MAKRYTHRDVEVDAEFRRGLIKVDEVERRLIGADTEQTGVPGGNTEQPTIAPTTSHGFKIGWSRIGGNDTVAP